MRRKTALMAAAMAGAAVMTFAAPVSAAEAPAASGSCYPGGWYDSNTYGYGCKNYPSGYQLQASAKCKNGKWTYGKIVSISGSSYTWSYAYCAGKGGYKLGTGGYVIFH